MGFIDYFKRLFGKKIDNNKTKVEQFIDGELNNLNAQDISPDLTVFKKFEMPSNPTLNDYKKRLDNANQSLPLPAAYKDALVSLRQIIRSKKKNNDNFCDEVETLYRYACEYNFFNAYPYLEKAQSPSFRVSEVLSMNDLHSLSMPYHKIGYQHINELKKNDIQWLVLCLGEPEQHTTAADYHNNLRSSLEEKIIEKKKERVEETMNFLKQGKK